MDGAVQKAPFPSLNLSHISYNDETWYNFTLPKEDPKKYMNHVAHPMSSADVSIFSLELGKLWYIKKHR